MNTKPTPYVRNKPHWARFERELAAQTQGDKTLAIKWRGHFAVCEPTESGKWDLFIDGRYVPVSKVNERYIWDVANIAIDKMRSMKHS